MDEMLWFLLGKSSGGGSGGGGVKITDITLNSDGTYTVTDENNNTHTLTVTETDGQITAITYDGNDVPLTFSSGLLTKLGEMDIDISRYPDAPVSNIGYQATFKVENDDYYVMSCLDGGSIVQPPNPTSDKHFGGWKDEDNKPVSFPFTPSDDVEITALLSTYNFLVNSANGSNAMMTLNGANYTCTGLNVGNGASPDGNNDICGYVYYDGYTSPVIVTGVSRNNAINRGGYKANATTPITYNGKTYYYGIGLGYPGEYQDTSELNRYYIGSATSEEGAVTKLLNAFFGVV